MIGVVAGAADHEVVRELFELFKTPWEFYREGVSYDAVLFAGEPDRSVSAKLVLIYSGNALQHDQQGAVQAVGNSSYRDLLYKGRRLPIYGKLTTFTEARSSELVAKTEPHSSGLHVHRAGEQVVVRVGYDLFSEIRTLLSFGQPSENSLVPTVELHIAILRNLIVSAGIELTEIPPVPKGYSFIVCLTHDVDHPLLRNHGWDHTALGFLYRALLVSPLNFIKGRLGFSGLLRNWWAAIKLPFVQVGFAKDFWSNFDERYLELEEGIPSTYFVIPFRDHPGKRSDGAAPGFRAAKYGARDVADTLRRLSKADCEISLHGLDAWIDTDRGREELQEIRSITGSENIGVRMHWLYFDKNSPATLEEAGAAYDSTVGYNDTVGYRAGTTQVYKPFNAKNLLELPMHAMDTAFFYPNYLNVSAERALELLDELFDNAAEFGGCMTINWHDRSVAPERLWGDVYKNLIDRAKTRGALFLTAKAAVSWFRERRAIRFSGGCEGNWNESQVGSLQLRRTKHSLPTNDLSGGLSSELQATGR